MALDTLGKFEREYTNCGPHNSRGYRLDLINIFSLGENVSCYDTMVRVAIPDQETRLTYLAVCALTVREVNFNWQSVMSEHTCDTPFTFHLEFVKDLLIQSPFLLVYCSGKLEYQLETDGKTCPYSERTSSNLR